MALIDTPAERKGVAWTCCFTVLVALISAIEKLRREQSKQQNRPWSVLMQQLISHGRVKQEKHETKQASAYSSTGRGDRLTTYRMPDTLLETFPAITCALTIPQAKMLIYCMTILWTHRTRTKDLTAQWKLQRIMNENHTGFLYSNMADYSVPRQEKSGTTAEEVHTRPTQQHSPTLSIHLRRSRYRPKFPEAKRYTKDTTRSHFCISVYMLRHWQTNVVQYIWELVEETRSWPCAQVTTPAPRGDCATLASPRRICRSALLPRLHCHQSAIPGPQIKDNYICSNNNM